MEYTRLGRTGLQVSRLCLGCMTYGEPGKEPHPWTMGEEEGRPYIRRALEAGINFFDTANAYSRGVSEEILGRALKDFARRDEVVVATKAYQPWRRSTNTGGLSRKALFQAVDDSLKRLDMDYVDILFTHRWDHDTPIEETLEAMADLVRAGKVLYIAASTMWAWQFMYAVHVSRTNGWPEFVAMQNFYNLLYREEEREMIPLCRELGVATTPWSPLARGRLTRPWDETTERSETDKVGKHLYRQTLDCDRTIVDTVAAIAEERGVSRAQIALAWVLAKPGVTAPIIGASKPHHLDDAVAAVDLELTAEEMERLESPYVPHEVQGMARPMGILGPPSVVG